MSIRKEVMPGVYIEPRIALAEQAQEVARAFLEKHAPGEQVAR